MDDVENFDKSKFGLHPIRHELWDGFIFINFSMTAPPLKQWLGDLPRFTENYNIEQMQSTRTVTDVVECNWKVFVENAIEEYHSETVHKIHIDPVNPQKWSNLEAAGPYTAIYGVGSLTTRNSRGFAAIPGLSEEQQQGAYWFIIHPNMALNLTPYYVQYRLHFPEGPHRTRVISTFCFPRETTAAGDPGARDPSFYEGRDKVLAEDIVIAANVQHGLQSKLYRPGRYSPREAGAHSFAKYIIEKVSAAGNQAASQ
jgi:choline monooxygenase